MLDKHRIYTTKNPIENFKEEKIRKIKYVLQVEKLNFVGVIVIVR
jgi:hypothetical protein